MEWAAENWRKLHGDVDLFRRIKYVQGYKDRDQGKDPRYHLEDGEDEVERKEYEDEDTEAEEEDNT